MPSTKQTVLITGGAGYVGAATAHALLAEARAVLREKFLDADVGVTGANFLVAETGSSIIVTNEGNGRMTTTLPRVHVAITGIEKVVATREDLTTLLRLLPRSATGQSITNYISITSGTAAAGEKQGGQGKCDKSANGSKHQSPFVPVGGGWPGD